VTITRQRVVEEKRVARKMDYHPTTQTVHMLCDSLLELLDTVDGGQDQRDWEQERAELDKQVRLALADLRVEVQHLADDSLHRRTKAMYTLDMIDEMLSAKLRNRKKWDWYQPRIEEEFA
jgi:hypothetical protein